MILTASLYTIIKFKKYRDMNHTLKTLIERDIDYIKWLCRKGYIQFDNDAMIYYKEVSAVGKGGFRSVGVRKHY